MAVKAETNEQDPVTSIINSLKGAIKSLSNILRREEQEVSEISSEMNTSSTPQPVQQNDQNQPSAQSDPQQVTPPRDEP